MIIESISVKSLAIPFRQPFRHAAAVRSATETVWVEAISQDGRRGFGEGCPRGYVTGESLATAAAFITRWRKGWIEELYDLESVRRWVNEHRLDIDRNPAAWSAVELALLDLLGKSEGRPIESLLGVPGQAGQWRYTAVLGDAPLPRFEAQLARCVAAGFRDYKIKLSGDGGRDRAKVAALAAHGIPPQAVRADANGLWRDADAAMRALRALDFPFLAVEEPVRAGDYTGMRRISAASGFRIILDESLLRIGQVSEVAADPDRWVANLRVSKMGGLLRSLEMVDALRASGARAICGAHVGETSLLARAGMTVASSARDLLIGLEGAYGTHLLVTDVAEVPVMLGRDGIVDVSEFPICAPGLGLQIRDPLPHAFPSGSAFRSSTTCDGVAVTRALFRPAKPVPVRVESEARYDLAESR